MTAAAHNAPNVGYYKFTARTAADLRAIDKILLKHDFVRIHSARVTAPPPASLVALEHLLESLGCKITTVNAVRPRRLNTKTVTHSHFERRKSRHGRTRTKK